VGLERRRGKRKKKKKKKKKKGRRLGRRGELEVGKTRGNDGGDEEEEMGDEHQYKWVARSIKEDENGIVLLEEIGVAENNLAWMIAALRVSIETSSSRLFYRPAPFYERQGLVSPLSL